MQTRPINIIHQPPMVYAKDSVTGASGPADSVNIEGAGKVKDVILKVRVKDGRNDQSQPLEEMMKTVMQNAMATAQAAGSPVALVSVMTGGSRPADSVVVGSGKVKEVVLKVRVKDGRSDQSRPLEEIVETFMENAMAAAQAAGSPVASNCVLVTRFEFETYESPNGRGVKFVQPKLVSPLQMVNAINAESQRQWGRDAIHEWFPPDDYGMKRRPKTEIAHDFVPMVKGSNYKTRDEQKSYLEEKGMSFVERSVVIIAAGLFRLQNGFPKKGIEASKDQGDLFKHMAVRARSGAVNSDDFGVAGYCGSDVHFDDVFAAGSRISKS